MATEQEHVCGLTSSIIESAVADKIISSGYSFQLDMVPFRFQCSICKIHIEKDIPLGHKIIGATKSKVVETMVMEWKASTTPLAEFVRESRVRIIQKECPRLKQMFKKSS